MKCARKVCQNEGTCRHTQTGELYCRRCARKINEMNCGGVKDLIEIPKPDKKEVGMDDKNVVRDIARVFDNVEMTAIHGREVRVVMHLIKAGYLDMDEDGVLHTVKEKMRDERDW